MNYKDYGNRIICALLFMVAGILHFLKPQPFIAILPAVLPFPVLLIYISGLWEIMGAVALLTAKYRKLGRIALIVLLIAVFPANINMAVNKLDFGFIPHTLLWWRLPLQMVLIYWVSKVR